MTSWIPDRSARAERGLVASRAQAGVSLADIVAARRRLRPHVVETPLALSDSLTALAGAPVWLKLEHRQRTGSFKLRGATNAVLALDKAEAARGVVGVSTGNHGRGLAHAARAAGLRCVICLSRLVPANKIEAIRALGAELRIVGESQDAALAEAEGLVMIPPFDHPAIIAGQGTIALEILDAAPMVGTVVVPVSGGGLISGIARGIKGIKPDARVIGVSMARGAAMHASLAAGKPVQVEELPTLADSLGGGIGLDNRLTFAMVRELVDELVLLSEAEIADGIRHAYWREQEIVEGAAAVGIAALKAGRLSLEGETVIVLSGRNIDMALHHRVISGEDVEAADLKTRERS